MFSVALWLYCQLRCPSYSTFFDCGNIVNFVTSETKAAEQYFPVVLFIMLYKVVLVFECVNEILKCDHSNKNY